MVMRKDNSHIDNKSLTDDSRKLAITKPSAFVILLGVLLVMVLYLQIILWIGEGSVAELSRLKQSITEAEAENKALQARNQKLILEVEALRNGLELIEYKARKDLGLVKEDEIFYHVIDRRGEEQSHESTSPP